MAEEPEQRSKEGKVMEAGMERLLEAANLVKLGMAPELKTCLSAAPQGSVNHKDGEGTVTAPALFGRALQITEHAGVFGPWVSIPTCGHMCDQPALCSTNGNASVSGFNGSLKSKNPVSDLGRCMACWG